MSSLRDELKFMFDMSEVSKREKAAAGLFAWNNVRGDDKV